MIVVTIMGIILFHRKYLLKRSPPARSTTNAMMRVCWITSEPIFAPKTTAELTLKSSDPLRMPNEAV